MSSPGSLDLILTSVPELAALLTDPTITEVLVNADGQVWVERAGRLESTDTIMRHTPLRTAIDKIAASCGTVISAKDPILSARLEDGSRVAATFPPVSVGGPTLAIRKFPRRFTLAELVAGRMLSQEEALALTAGIVAGENFIIAGAPGAGKTALGNAILGTLPRAVRVGIIEDTAEMVVTSPNQFRLEARQPTRLQPDMQPVTIAQLIRHSLRYRADVLCIGEVRGEEAWDLLQLLNTGHRGSLCTIHANSGDDALARFATCVLQSGVNLPYENIKERIGACVNRVLYVEKDSTGVRRVREHVSVRGYDLTRREYRTAMRTAHTPEAVEV